MSETTTRSRLVTWEDPKPGAEANRTLSGLEFFLAMAEGKLPHPPITDLLNFRVAQVEKGKIVFEVEPAEYHYNPGAVVHGGLAATLCDSAGSCAIHTTLPPAMFCTTVNLNVTYTRPITADSGTLRCIGEVIHAGRRMATSQAQLLDKNGKLYAHATVTCMIIEL